MITISGEVKDIKAVEFDSDGVKKVFYDVLLDIGRPYPEKLRLREKPKFEIGDSVEDLDVRGTAYSRTEKKYLQVVYSPIEN